MTVSWPVLKAPMVSALDIKHHKLLSTFAFNLNLRRYSEAMAVELRREATELRAAAAAAEEELQR